MRVPLCSWSNTASTKPLRFLPEGPCSSTKALCWLWLVQWPLATSLMTTASGARGGRGQLFSLRGVGVATWRDRCITQKQHCVCVGLTDGMQCVSEYQHARRRNFKSYLPKKPTSHTGRGLCSGWGPRHRTERLDPPAEAAVLGSELYSAPELPCQTLSAGIPLHPAGL